MGGVIGRVFNEFAVVIGLAILISGFVSLTLTPMLCSRFLRRDVHPGETGAALRLLERGYTAMLRGYERSLEVILRHPRFTLSVTALTVALTGYLLYVIPKGLFPTEDTGFLNVTTEAAEDISFPAMVEKQFEIDSIIRANPYVGQYNNEVGYSGNRFGVNGGTFYLQLKPRNERPR